MCETTVDKVGEVKPLKELLNFSDKRGTIHHRVGAKFIYIPVLYRSDVQTNGSNSFVSICWGWRCVRKKNSIEE